MFAFGKAGNGICQNGLRARGHAVHQRFGLGRQVHAPPAAIGRVVATLHQTELLQPVDHATGGNGFHFEPVCQSALIGAWIALDCGKHAPLRPGDAKRARGCGKALAEQAPDIR